MKNTELKRTFELLNLVDQAPVENLAQLEQELRQKLSRMTKYARLFPVRQPVR